MSASFDRVPPGRVGDAIAAIRTPALVVDLDRFERNLRFMADALAGSGIALRPHAKSHKCVDIARAQMRLGAVGVCCQTLREAAAMVAAGIPDVLVTNEIVGIANAEGLVALASVARLGVLADNERNVHELARAASDAHVALRVLVEVDVGAHRCGVPPGEPAVALARAIASAPGLVFGGIHAYHGAAQHRRTPDERAQAIAEAVQLAQGTKEAIEAAGVACETVTGGGTGTWQLECASGVYTEVQPGSYVFMDADYARNALAPEQHAFEQSLFVLARVISTPVPERIVVDAGLKAIAFDSGLPLVHHAAALAYVKASDEHGVIEVGASAIAPAPGEHVWLVPGHCDPTVNLHDFLVGVRDGRVECVWPVAARGY